MTLKIPSNPLLCSLQKQTELDTGFTDIPKIISEEDVDILSYMDWTEEKLQAAYSSSSEDDDVWGTTKESEINNSASSIHNNDFHLFQTESEERWLCSSTFEDSSAACNLLVADYFYDDSEDDYEIMKKSAARSFPPPSSSSSWRPSRFEGSIYDYRRCLTNTNSTLPPCPATRLDALEAAPIHQASRRWELPVEVLHELSSSSSFAHVGASMSDRLRPPAASQVSYDMSPPPSAESLSSIRRILPPSADAMMSRTRPAPPPPPLSSYEPPSSDLLSLESPDCIEDRLDCLTQMSPICFPMSPIVSSEEFASGFYSSNLPVCADPPPLPHRRLAFHRAMSMTPSPALPPAISHRVGAPVSSRRMAGDFAFAKHAVSPQPSPAAFGGFGGSLRSRNERLASGSSALVSRRVKGKERLLRRVDKPDTVAWNELFELQHEVFTHDLIQ